ncbi:LuxR family transcriptional regulator [Burkholderia lata]|uniref:LuxR family transcriptional regulator n=1 Tax=Burkholderia lata (strain ATCC 17760 / DSM 23089 / LMG 22485 / NCIMB 9086 / R18194 / 383) TaxID=482957 RepID=A0A6P3C426_BURL3|nr:helix-turn-helix domain-containing protein [Burkholderia lata]VWD63298.1 LuxR family transcriptional regulator [Burkholderia lata]
METFSRTIGEILRPNGLTEGIDRLAEKIGRVIPFDKCLILHGGSGDASSDGLIYRYGAASDLAGARRGLTLFGAGIDIDRYLSCFTLSDRQDHTFRWHDLDAEMPQRDALVNDVASYMQGRGIVACIGAPPGDSTAIRTILQLKCEDTTLHSALLVSLIAMHLHATLTQKITRPSREGAEPRVAELDPEACDDLNRIRFTRKESDVIKWVVEGKTAWEIGRILSMSERTVKFHLTNVYEKLRVTNRAQAVAKVSRLGLI